MPQTLPHLHRLREIAAVARREGETRRTNAAYAGDAHDCGGLALIDQVDAFLAGLDRRLPPGWERYADQADREADPDYATYQRLKAKFGEG